MPTYGYQCTACKHEFSVFQAMKDDPIAACPECGSPVKRLLYPVGIVFKGSGWYVNDSRKPDKSETQGQDKPAGDAGASSDSAKSDGSKTEALGDKATTPSAKSESSGDKAESAAKPAPAAASAEK